MIIALLIISAIAAFVFFVYISQPTVRISLTIVSLILLLGSIVMLVRNDHDHYGMNQVTTTTTTGLASATNSKAMKVLLYQPVGTGDHHRVYIYKKSASQKKAGHTQANIKTSNKVKTTTGTPKIVTKTTRWQYQSGTAKFWFGVADNDKQLIKRTNTFYVPKSWLVLSASQAKKLGKLVKAEQPKLKAQAKQYVAAQVKAAMMKDPTMSTAKRNALTKEAAAKYQQQAMAKIIQQVKATK